MKSQWLLLGCLRPNLILLYPFCHHSTSFNLLDPNQAPNHSHKYKVPGSIPSTEKKIFLISLIKKKKKATHSLCVNPHPSSSSSFFIAHRILVPSHPLRPLSPHYTLSQNTGSTGPPMFTSPSSESPPIFSFWIYSHTIHLVFVPPKPMLFLH